VVPEIVISEHEGQMGSFQEWIDGEIGGHAGPIAVQELFNREDTQDRLEVLVALDWICKNGDRHDGNWLVGDDGKLYAIDHGYTHWSKQPEGVLEQRLSPAWQGYWVDPPFYAPGVTLEERGGRNYLSFKFRESTLERWRGIDFIQFQNVVARREEQADDYRLPTRVNTDAAWDNFRQLLEHGEVVNVRVP
jgi:hypothetical protein